jgi:hypothetical protein
VSVSTFNHGFGSRNEVTGTDHVSTTHEHSSTSDNTASTENTKGGNVTKVWEATEGSVKKIEVHED